MLGAVSHLPFFVASCRARSLRLVSRKTFAMEADVRTTVEQIHACPTQVVLYVAGGGSQALGWLLSVPGASSTLLEALVPYSRASLSDLLGGEPPKFVCAATAHDMAATAYRRALRLSPPGAEVAGVALTAALSSVAPKRGELACFVATRSSAGATLRSVSFAKGARDRAEEDRVASRLLIRTLAEACGVASDVPPPLLDEAAGERHFREDSPVGADAIGALLAGRVGCVELTRGAATGVGACRARVLLCGSFNPLHDGHTALLAAAVAAVAPPADESVESGAGGGYELSVRNADKAPLQRAELERRAAAFAPDPHPLVLTNAPLFADKAELLPGTVFVVGVDTALRILDPKYYVPPSTSAPVPGAAAGASAAGAGEEGLRACLRRIARTRCSFLIAGRVVGGGVFVGPDALRVPPGFEHLFCPLPSFRRDISSTQLRERAAAAGGAAARGGA